MHAPSSMPPWSMQGNMHLPRMREASMLPRVHPVALSAHLYRHLCVQRVALSHGFAPASSRRVSTLVVGCNPLTHAHQPCSTAVPQQAVEERHLFREVSHALSARKPTTLYARGTTVLARQVPSDESWSTPASHCHGEGWQQHHRVRQACDNLACSVNYRGIHEVRTSTNRSYCVRLHLMSTAYSTPRHPPTQWLA